MAAVGGSSCGIGAFGHDGGHSRRARSAVGAHGTVEEHWPPRFEKFWLKLENEVEVAFTDPRRFGRLRLRKDPLHEPPISDLGPDPIVDEINLSAVSEALLRRRAADQERAAGPEIYGWGWQLDCGRSVLPSQTEPPSTRSGPRAKRSQKPGEKDRFGDSKSLFG